MGAAPATNSCLTLMPDADPLALLDATAQADLVRRGEVSPTELVDAAIARIEAVDPSLNAVVIRRFDAAATRRHA